MPTNYARFRSILTGSALLVAMCSATKLYSSVQSPEEPSQPDVAGRLFEVRRLLAGADYIAADRVLRDILRQASSSAEAHFLLGFTLLHEQKPKESIAEYIQGAKLKEPGASELLGFASAQTLLKQYAGAEHSLLAATKLAPERPLLWYLLGRSQLEQSHWADAERSLLTSLRLEPQSATTESDLGLIYEKMQRPESAISAYRAAIALEESQEDKDPQPYLALGMLLRKQGKATDAVPLLVMATGAKSPNYLAHQELGLAYEQLRRYEEARGEMSTAVFLAPEVQSLHFFLGRIYRETGRQAEAAQEFARAARLSADPATPSGGAGHTFQ